MDSSTNARTCRWLILTAFLCLARLVAYAQQPVSTQTAQRHLAILAEIGKHEYTQALAESKALITDEPNFVAAYEKLVIASQRAGDLDQAQVFFTKQLASPLNNLRAHFGLGLISLERGDPATAIEEYKKCLLAFPEFLPAHTALIDASRDLDRLPEVEQFLKSLPQTTGPLYAVCYLRYKQARYEDSIMLSQQVLLLEPHLYQALQTTAYSLYALGRYAEAHQVAQTILQEATEPENIELRLRLLILKGMTAAIIGSPNEGISDLISAYRGIVEVGNLALEENVHSQLGQAYERQNDCAPSLFHHQAALAVGQQLKSRFIGRHLGNIGSAYACLGDMTEAVSYYRQALDWHSNTGLKDQPNVVTLLTNLADNDLDDNSAALSLLEQALTATRAITNKVMEVRVRLALGAVYEKTGDHLAALEQTKSALRIAQEKNVAVQEGHSWNQLGRIYFSLSDLVQAMGAHRRALTIGNHTQAPQVIWEALTGLAAIQQRQGQSEQAAQLYRQAIDTIESLRSRIGISEDRASFFADKIDAHKKLISVLLQSGNKRNNLSAAEAFHYSERGRARAFLDLLAETKVDLARGAAPDILEQQQKLQQQVSQLTDQLIRERSQDSNSQDKAKIAKLETDLGQADVELADWLRELRRRNPRYAALKYPEPITLAETQGMLDDNTVLLSYSLAEPESFLFAVSRNDFQVKRLSGEKTLAANVQKLLTAITDKNNPAPAEYHRQAASLSQQLLQPVSGMLAGKTALIIVADGALHRLPFEVLFQPGVPQRGDLRQWPFLVRQFAISYAPSASVLAQLQNESHAAAPKSFIAFGDPKYELADAGAGAATLRTTSASGRLNFQPLPYSHTEIDGIAQLFAKEDRELFFREAATEENVKVPERLSSYRLVHFSTHGYVNEARPRFSGLVLSLRSNLAAEKNIPPGDDGLLAAYEIFNLKLKADLVVLSACETGLGKEVKGEGLMSLTRAFMYAGTPSVVVSLWNVNDQSAADLMVRFYRHLQAGKTRREALRQAQLETIRDNGFPFFWAPFVLVGKP
jgi:CHAT domain-containing protein/Tfp pilus assembly protein PilF